MARWWTLTSLLLVLLGLPGGAHAQSYDPYSPGVAPAGWQEYGHVQPAYKDKAMVRSSGPVGPLPAGPGRTIYEQLPDDRGFLYPDTPLERILKDTFRHAYFRADYLNWSMSRPGNVLVGSDTAIIGLDFINNISVPTAPGQPPLFPGNNPATNTIAYPNAELDPYLFQPFIDPRTPFQVSNPATGNNSLIAVLQPNFDDVRNSNNNGIRGTFGLPIAGLGTFEYSAFGLQTSSSIITRAPIRQWNIFDSNGNGIPDEVFTPLPVGEFGRDGLSRDTPINDYQAYAIPILVDGMVPQPGFVFTPGLLGQPVASLPPITNPLSPGTEFVDPLNPDPNNTQEIPGRGDNFRIVWDLGYNATLRSRLWGTEGNFFWDTWDPNSPLSIQPLVGFRYLRFNEEFHQRGRYTYLPPGQLNSVPVNRRIDTAAVNNIFGPQAGLRAELASRWFTLGAQPKIMLGVNNYETDLETQNVLAPVGQPTLPTNEINQSLRNNSTTFGVMADLEVYTKLHVTEHFSLNVGYNLMWAGLVTRPFDNVIYNARTIVTPNNVTPDTPDGDGTVSYDLQSDFRLDPKFSGLLIQGLNIGGEFRY